MMKKVVNSLILILHRTFQAFRLLLEIRLMEFELTSVQLLRVQVILYLIYHHS